MLPQVMKDACRVCCKGVLEQRRLNAGGLQVDNTGGALAQWAAHHALAFKLQLILNKLVVVSSRTLKQT
jgi:hypothetical protein